jgi:hypothetical protein
MPGQMQQDNNIFVLPQFPELGWNEQVPPLPQVNDDNFFQPEHEGPEQQNLQQQHIDME